MTEFKRHDRVRVIDDSPMPLGAMSGLTKGDIHTIHKDQIKGSRSVSVALPAEVRHYFSSRFELVERAVNTDKDGKPLYIGDHVRRHAGEGVIDYRAIVVEQEPQRGGPRRREDVVVLNKAMRGAPRDLVELVRHHWEPETEPPTLQGPIVEGHPVGAGSFMVLKRASALAWGKVDGWSVGDLQVSVSLWSDGSRTTYVLNDSRDTDPWRVLLHHPAEPRQAEMEQRCWGFDGLEVIELKMPKLDPAEFEKQMAKYADLFAAVNRSPIWSPKSLHSIGIAVDVPIFDPAPISWNDLQVGAEVTLKHRKTERTEAVGTVESFRGGKDVARIPFIKLRGIGGSFYANNWEITTLKLPAPPQVDGSIVRNRRTGTEAHLIAGEWRATDGAGPLAVSQWEQGFDVIRDAGKEN
jgi:hypothetical protein